MPLLWVEGPKGDHPAGLFINLLHIPTLIILYAQERKNEPDISRRIETSIGNNRRRFQ